MLAWTIAMMMTTTPPVVAEEDELDAEAEEPPPPPPLIRCARADSWRRMKTRSTMPRNNESAGGIVKMPIFVISSKKIIFGRLGDAGRQATGPSTPRVYPMSCTLAQ